MAAYTAINDSSLFFTPVIWTGSGAQQTISVPFQGDFIWVKNRGSTPNHASQDSVIGFGTRLSPNRDVAEGSEPHGIGTVSSSGFNFQGTYDGSGYNESSETYVAWCWKESATAGFDIVSYTGNGSTRTISHSLSAVPKLIIWKNRSVTSGWQVWHSTLPLSSSEYQALQLNGSDASANFGTYNLMNATAPTSSVFTTDAVPEINGNTNSIIAYLFAEKQGFSKFGSYTGNGSTNGPFVYTGFRPAFVLWKKSSGTGNWLMMDNKRSTYNFAQTYVKANEPAPEDATSSDIRWDFLSSGLKCRGDNAAINTSGETYIFMAFAEAPFVNSEGVPCNAR